MLVTKRYNIQNMNLVTHYHPYTNSILDDFIQNLVSLHRTIVEILEQANSKYKIELAVIKSAYKNPLRQVLWFRML